MRLLTSLRVCNKMFSPLGGSFNTIVNSRLINMSGERDITFIDHTDTIDTERHLNESKVHLNKSGTIEFAKNVFEFLLQQD